MALSRTWYTRGNVPVADHSTAALLAKSVIWGLKAWLCQQLSGGTLGASGAAPGGAAWTVVSSSDGASAGASDLWGGTFDGTKIVRAAAGVAHSWILLQSPAALGPVYLLLDYSTGSNQNLHIYASKTAFSGGTVTDRPTSANSWTVMSDQQLVENVITDHCLHGSIDANGNYFFMTSKNSSGFFWFFNMGVTLVDGRAGDTNLFFTTWDFQTSARGTGDGASVAGRVNGRTYNNGAASNNLGVLWTNSGFGNFGGASGPAANQLDSKFDTLPFYVISTVAAAQGVRGRFPDLVYVGSAPVGGSDPNTGAQERVVMNCFLVPNGVVATL